MNIQQVEQAPAPITESLFEFPLHFTGLNPDRDSDLQGRTSHRTCSALPQPVPAGSVYPGWLHRDCAREGWGAGKEGWAPNGAERTVPLKLSIMKGFSGRRNSTPCSPQESHCRNKKTISRTPGSSWAEPLPKFHCPLIVAVDSGDLSRILLLLSKYTVNISSFTFKEWGLY